MNKLELATAAALDRVGISVSHLLEVVGKGDVEGHPFRGNQWTEGQGSGEESKPHVTETPEFKKWFGDSKVVDESGKPLVVYHGNPSTTETPTVFHCGKSGGAFFTDDPYSAEGFTADKGTISPVYLKIENPLDLREYGQDVSGVYALRDALVEGGMSESQAARLFDVDEDDPERSSVWYYVRHPAISKAIQKLYDGMIFEDYSTPANPDATYTSYVVFSPTQIKSATGNRGTFDPNDPDITKSTNSTRLQLATAAVEAATATLEAKRRSLQRRFYREAVKVIHLRSEDATRRDLQQALIPVIRGHVAEAAKMIGRGKKKIKAPDKWRDDLVNACLPVLAVRMAEAARNQLTQLGARNPRRRKDS